MSIQQFGRKFPVLLRMSNPRGQVELIETIGKGNYGYVYRGKLIKSNVIAAVKVVQLKEDELRETLLEMEILEACNHPNVTRFLGCFLKGLDLWICMEFCGAGSLDSFYRNLKQNIGENYIACIMYESLLGLEYLHNEKALIHRDIKAGNLLVSTDGLIKLADFGVSAQLEDSNASANTFIGTPYWMAPEVIMTEDSDVFYTTKADIWSIGITAIEIAEKNPPLSDIHPMRALKMIPTSDMGLAKPKTFSKPFVDFVNICLTKNPNKRPSATELLKHPFIVMGKDLPRQELIKELVDKVATAKLKKKQGIEDDDEEEDKKEGPQKVVQEVVKYATQARQSPGQLPSFVSSAPSFSLFGSSSQPQELRSININEFPVLVSKVKNKQDEVFDPTPVLAVNMDILTTAILDEHYLLLGCERGLFFVDISSDVQIPLPLLNGVRFRQLQVLNKYNLLIGLSGKRDHVRQYKLSSIRKLIRYLQGEDPFQLNRMDFNVPIQQAKEKQDQVDEEYQQANRFEQLDEEQLVTQWTGDYIKILDTRDSKSFLIEETETSIYLVVLFRQALILFEWARAPYNKFMKLKDFWLPEQPKFMSVAQDGVQIKDVYLGYATELNLVNAEDSKVREVRVDRDYVAASGKARWRSFVQIPFSEAKLKELLKANARQMGTVNRKIAAAAQTIARNKLEADRYFLGTYGRMTKVVDKTGIPMDGSGVGGWANGVVWSEQPNAIVLRPLEHVVALGSNIIEVVDWKSADLRQRLQVDSSSSIKLLNGFHGQTIISIEKKRKGCALYLLKEKTSGPRPAGSIFEAIQAQMPQETEKQHPYYRQDQSSTSGTTLVTPPVVRQPSPVPSQSSHTPSSRSHPAPSHPGQTHPAASQPGQSHPGQSHVMHLGQSHGPSPVSPRGHAPPISPNAIQQPPVHQHPNMPLRQVPPISVQAESPLSDHTIQDKQESDSPSFIESYYDDDDVPLQTSLMQGIQNMDVRRHSPPPQTREDVPPVPELNWNQIRDKISDSQQARKASSGSVEKAEQRSERSEQRTERSEQRADQRSERGERVERHDRQAVPGSNIGEFRPDQRRADIRPPMRPPFRPYDSRMQPRPYAYEPRPYAYEPRPYEQRPAYAVRPYDRVYYERPMRPMYDSSGRPMLDPNGRPLFEPPGRIDPSLQRRPPYPVDPRMMPRGEYRYPVDPRYNGPPVQQYRPRPYDPRYTSRPPERPRE